MLLFPPVWRAGNRRLWLSSSWCSGQVCMSHQTVVTPASLVQRDPLDVSHKPFQKPSLPMPAKPCQTPAAAAGPRRHSHVYPAPTGAKKTGQVMGLALQRHGAHTGTLGPLHLRPTGPPELRGPRRGDMSSRLPRVGAGCLFSLSPWPHSLGFLLVSLLT